MNTPLERRWPLQAITVLRTALWGRTDARSLVLPLVDDHAIVRHGLRTFFETQPDLLVMQSE